MNYLKFNTQCEALGVAHWAYVKRLNDNGHTYSNGSITKYDSDVVKDPSNNDYYIVIPDEYLQYVPGEHGEFVPCPEFLQPQTE